MKILYVTDFQETSLESGGFISDYLNDLTFHGLKQLYGKDVTALIPPIHLYKESQGGAYNHMFQTNNMESHFWGGMTSFYLLDRDYDPIVLDGSTKERKEWFDSLRDRIVSKEFDLIIWGNARRCLHMFRDAKEIYPKEQLILLDGNDDTKLLDLADQGYPYFKRELNDYSNLPSNIKPITFSYPEEKIGRRTKNKTQKTGTVIPGDESTYIFRGNCFSFDMEKKYYKDYNKSYFGLTEKKAGWDCMRHYEIMGNYCLPYFPDLIYCPNNTLHNFPKKLIIEGNRLMDNFDEQEYFRILDEMFEYFKNNLTTKAVAQDLINRINGE
tara:strand:- start:145 stop:1122 length:978 start_codon:yes stop_codon:yes gene_type:complete